MLFPNQTDGETPLEENILDLMAATNSRLLCTIRDAVVCLLFSPRLSYVHIKASIKSVFFFFKHQTKLNLSRSSPQLMCFIMFLDGDCASFQLLAMSLSLLLLLAVLVDVTDTKAGSDFRICAFNTQHFGESKSKKSDVMGILARVR